MDDHKQNKNSSIMKWIKASERLPDWDNVIMQSVLNDGGQITRKQIFRDDFRSIDLARKRVILKCGRFILFGELEWLDESPSGETLDAVEFAEWIHNKGYMRVKSEDTLWGIGRENENYSTSELYNLFLQQTGKPSVDTQQAKENRDLKEEVRKLRNQIAMIESDYWKQRCEAVEKLMNTLSGRDVTWDNELYYNWQNLKQQSLKQDK